MMKRFLSLAVVAVALFVWAPAQASTEQVTNFNSQATLSKTGTLDVTETITYDFGPTAHHGIYRKIATDYPAPNGKHYYLKLDYMGAVDQTGAAYQTSTSKDSNGVEVLKIGDPNRTITGTHVYKLHYTLSPIVTAGDKGQLLNFNVVGNDWEVPILAVSSVVTLPEGINPIASNCFTGPQGSTAHDCQTVGTTTVAQNLAPGSGLTVAYDLPAGTVSTLATPSSQHYSFGDIMIALGIVVGIIALIITLVVFVVRRSNERRRKQRQTVIAQYEAPGGLSPAEIGYLVDDKSSTVEITATLIDLAVRGHLKITQTQAKGLMKSAHYQLTKLTGRDTLQPYEQSLYNAVFSTGDVVEVHKLNRTTMSLEVTAFNKALKALVTARGYYADSKATKGMWKKLTVGGQLTDIGAKEWAEVSGFKLYLSVVEKDRLKFTDAPARTPERFSALLPYAIALGVEKEWADQFKDIDMSQGVDWYDGNNGLTGGFIAASLVNDLSSGFSTAVSSSVVSASSSGGSSSGGGFGGGGGGSW